MLAVAFLCVGVVSATDLSAMDMHSADINSDSVLLNDGGNVVDLDNNQIVDCLDNSVNNDNSGCNECLNIHDSDISYDSRSSRDLVQDNNKSVSNIEVSSFKHNSQDVSSSLKNNDFGSFNDLSKDITDSLKNKNGVITLDKDYKYSDKDDFDSGIVINCNHNLIIDGNGHSIDGSNLARVFKVLSDGVTIKNINFINTNGRKEGDLEGFGGAIYWPGAYGSLINCNFTNSTSGELFGGSVFWKGSNAYVKDCTFNGSTSNIFGGSIYFTDVNSAMVTKCTFINSKCSREYSRGGSISFFNSNNCNVVDCTFINSTSWRGTISLESDSRMSDESRCFIKGCKFIDCSASNSGGAIFSDNVNCYVTSCDFVNCSASNFGGAIYNHRGNLNVVSCKCTPLDGDLKAPIYNDGTILSKMVVTTLNGKDIDSTFWNVVNATATVTVSGIPVAGGVISFNINNHTIDGVSNSDGIYSVLYEIDFKNTQPVNASYLNVKGNQSLNAGNIRSKSNSTWGNYTELQKLISDAQSEGKNSIVLDKDYKYDINDKLSEGLSFIKGNFVIDGNGHSIDGSNLARVFDVKMDNITLKNINFINTKGSDFAGAIYWSGCSGSVINCNFTNSTINDHSAQGGSIYWSGDDGSVIGCNFINSSLKNSGNGGAIYWKGIYGCISECTFTNSTINGINSYGGAIEWVGIKGSVKNCTFTNSTISYDKYGAESNYGGSIAWHGIEGSIIDCTFTNSTIAGLSSYGGSISVFGNSCSLNGCNFVESNHYAVFCNGGDVSLISCNFSNSNYGDIYWNGSNGCVKDCNLKDNRYNSIYWNGVNGSVSNSNFTNCHGSISWLGANGSVIGCSFTDSIVYEDGDGGAIYWRGSGACVKDCIFNHCSAFCSGGAIYFDNVANGTVVNCSFSDSHCSGHGDYYFNQTGDYVQYLDQESKGGAICLFSVENCSVINCNFVDSNSDWGGAIFVSGNNSSITGCKFTNSYASNNGGAICFVSSHSDINNCNFINYSTLGKGAAIYCGNNGPYGNWEYIPVSNSSISNCKFNNSKLNGDLSDAIFVDSGCFDITGSSYDDACISA